ncbi:MAG TPA: murein L,D-transpeptidase catalytic domain family protein [Thermoanaerobaculia bacterium]|nr:murein L,D-transpeptidase catalytic domain family protein [Thermoanaerobaculia bacterium]
MLTREKIPSFVPRPTNRARFGFRLLTLLPLLAAFMAANPAAAQESPTLPAVFKAAAGLSPKVLSQALDAVDEARARGISGKSSLLTIIDYSLPSTQPRLWVLDLARGKVLFHELVAHGAGSGDKVATRFSNVVESRATSLGLYLTGDTYEGGNGYSLKLKGLDEGVNDRAEERHIVMHGAWYVSADHVQQFGMLGRSWGCPALPLEDAKPVIDTIKNGSFVFSYAAQTAFSTASRVLRAATHGRSFHAPRRHGRVANGRAMAQKPQRQRTARAR